MYCTYSQYPKTVLYKTPTLSSLSAIILYIIFICYTFRVMPLISLLLRIPSLLIQLTLYVYAPPSPLSVPLTLYYDDVHSAGGGGQMLLGRGLGHDWRGLGHDSVKTGRVVV